MKQRPTSRQLRALVLALGLPAAIPSIAIAADTRTAAFFLSGNELWELCKSNHVIAQGTCKLIVSGVVDGIQVAALRPLCVPVTATDEQVRDIAIKWLTEHPAERHGPAAVSVALSMREAFPCSE